MLASETGNTENKAFCSALLEQLQVAHSKIIGNHLNDFQPLDFKHDFKGNQAVKDCMHAFSEY